MLPPPDPRVAAEELVDPDLLVCQPRETRILFNGNFGAIGGPVDNKVRGLRGPPQGAALVPGKEIFAALWRFKKRAGRKEGRS